MRLKIDILKCMENDLCYHLHLPDLPRYAQYEIRGSNFSCACMYRAMIAPFVRLVSHRACSTYDCFRIKNFIHCFCILIIKNETSGYYIYISWHKMILSKEIGQKIEHCVTQHSINI